MADSTITFVVLGVVVVCFVTNLVPVDVVAIGTPLVLWATGVLEVEAAFAGFGDPTVVFIAALFVVSEGLDATGVTAWAGQRLVEQAGTSRTRLLVLTMLLCAALTAAISVNGAVAALVPVVVVTAVRLQMPSSQLMMPLAFAAHAGSLLLLTGSPVNVLASDAVRDAGLTGFNVVEFAAAGIPLLAGTIAIVVLFGNRLLPERAPRYVPRDLSEHARVLMEHYELEDSDDQPLVSRRYGIAEVVVPPRSEVIGDRVFPGMVTQSGELVILAVRRHGEEAGPGESVLAAGDVLVVRGTWSALEEQLEDPAVLVVESPERIRRQAVPLGAGAKRALVILAGMFVLLATGAAPAAIAGVLAAAALVVTRVLTVEQAYRGITWTTVVLVGGLFALSRAMQVTGAAETLADGLVGVVGESGPYPLLIGIFVLTALLGQLISNTATALIMIPVALSAASELDVSARPVLMSLTVAAAAALLTPVATPANMMVMGPGGYRFGDYWKLGLVLLGWFFVVSVGIVPLVWRF